MKSWLLLATKSALHLLYDLVIMFLATLRTYTELILAFCLSGPDISNSVKSGSLNSCFASSHLRHAADINTYSIPGYSHYIPIKLFEAANKYVALFMAKYGPDNANLTAAMCSFTFVSFKCDIELDEMGFIDEHFREVHNIPGVPAMMPLQQIEVDAKQDFTLPDLTELEISGPDKQNASINSVYVRSVARNIITKSYNKCNADLVASKSQDFMLELSKRTNNNFLKRFQMHLSQKLGVDITNDFSCKWASIEKCLFKAMSAEQSSVRYAKFLETNYTSFHSMPM
jgi:hypothetical protein